MKCNRCLNNNPFLFRKIKCECNKCYYCLKCAHISIFKICDLLENNLVFKKQQLNYQLEYQLTKEQLSISSSLVNTSSKKIFINAVCGAGKTEMILEVIKNFVNDFKNVAYVAPRKEVVVEIHHRFEKIFKMKIGLITGEIKELEGNFFCLTNHQLLNYHNTFDLIIVDEVDAFPLYKDKVLNNGINNSLNDNGKLIMMSATPLNNLQNFETYNLNKRYHNHPIPIPTYIKEDIEVLKTKLEEKCWLIFFPTIKQLEEVYQIIDNKEIVICHSKINEISKLLTKLNNTFIIFTTAILERGITIANINVLVYNASHDNYHINTLIQMAGRVGRVVPYTNGEVIYMAKEKTFVINKAIKYLGSINE